MVALPTSLTPTVDAIYKSYEDSQGNGFRDHLGASLIGGPCDRQSWYSWRWATRAFHTGRLLRLFQTGNLAEARFTEDLRRIGVTVLDINPETGKQWQFRDETQHFGGSCDAVATGFPEASKSWSIVEMKTHSDKSFKSLTKDGVEKSKPEHYAQCQVYMVMSGIDRAMYIAVNKNDESLYVERLKLDTAFALRMLAKAKRIIESQNPPERVSQNPDWYICKWCSHNAVCFGEALPERHCRSCAFSEAAPEGKWMCHKHDMELSSKMQRQGCSQHKYLPSLIAGKQTDAAPDADWIEYELESGEIWRDTGPKT